MKLEWRNNVYLARSKIQGLGLYAARDLERHTMVIEYIGEIIRHELSESREKQYEARVRIKKKFLIIIKSWQISNLFLCFAESRNLYV